MRSAVHRLNDARNVKSEPCLEQARADVMSREWSAEGYALTWGSPRARYPCGANAGCEVAS